VSRRGGRYRIGRMMLVLGILGIFLPESKASMEEKKAAYDGLQRLLENVAMGIEEKQAEMQEMDASLSTQRAELIELEKTIRRRQKLIDLTSREIEDGILNLEEEKKAVEEKKAQAEQAEEPASCTVAMTEPERLTMRRGEVSGLQVIGVFTLCGLLATLGWGGVTSILVITAKAWTAKLSEKGTDASTNTEELVGSNAPRCTSLPH
jgi:hypothetical protein